MRKTCLLITIALAAVACSTPMSPTPPTPSVAASEGPEGGATSAAVTTERLRLRQVDGPDIVTGLVTGQVIAVPINVRLDIWAEVRRLETDRARLVVDWGNGNQDFSGCGACRIENTYTRPGSYAVIARVVDLNAPVDAAPIYLASVTLTVAPPAPAPTPCRATATAFVGNLNGVSNASVFETGLQTALPSLGWSNVSGTAQIWDLALNGAIFGGTQWGNYEVQHDTGIAVSPDTTYTVQFDMGYIAAIIGGNSAFRYQLGTLDGGIFTGLGVATTGSAPYAGNLNSGIVSATGQQTVRIGSSAPAGTLAFRWAQTATLGPGFSDHFGIDHVRLTATRCAP